MARRRMCDPEKEVLWRERLAEQAASGRTIAGWCRHSGIDDALFHYWRRTITRRDAGPGGPCPETPTGSETAAGRGDPALFARVFLAPAAAPAPGRTESRPAGGCLELIVAGGHVVRVPAGFDAPTLLRVLELLEARPC